MPRIFQIILSGVAVIAVAALLTWFLAFRVGQNPPSRLSVGGLEGPVDITWIRGGDAAVAIGSEGDRYRAVAAVHALGKPWMLLLYRQAALGRLSEWYGRETLGLDHHVHRLGIPSASRAAWDRLPDDDRAMLQAYADGVNAALASRRVRLAPAVSTLDVDPEPWQPWHSLAIERLVAWFGTRISTAPSMQSSPSLAHLMRARNRLGSLLGLGGLDHAATWFMDNQPSGLFVRYVYGSAGIPPVSMISMTSPAGVSELVTWIGMPVAWAGRDGSRSWAVLPAGRARVDSGAVAAAPVHVPLRLRNGSRDVVEQTASAGRAALVDDGILAWTGIEPVSDLASVRTLARGGSPVFLLFDGLALTTGRADPTPVSSFGAHTVRSGRVTLVSGAPEASALADRLAQVPVVGVPAVLGDAVSQWGTARHDLLVGEMRLDSALVASREPDLSRFLYNWNGSFDGPSIGATIFSELISAGQRITLDGFMRAMDSLRSRFGSNELMWRWEHHPGGRLVYPGFIRPGTFAELRPLPVRYAPVEVLRHGHPTAPAWGTASGWVDPPSPAAWEGFIEDRDGGRILYRRPFVPFDEMLGRFSVAPAERVLVEAPLRERTGDRTELVPAGS